MRTIGITGGVGAGKSEILAYLKAHYRCRVIMADEVARKLEEPGEICYKRIVALLGETILQEDGQIDRGAMAQLIFRKKALLEEINRISNSRSSWRRDRNDSISSLWRRRF